MEHKIKNQQREQLETFASKNGFFRCFAFVSSCNEIKQWRWRFMMIPSLVKTICSFFLHISTEKKVMSECCDIRCWWRSGGNEWRLKCNQSKIQEREFSAEIFSALVADDEKGTWIIKRLRSDDFLLIITSRSGNEVEKTKGDYEGGAEAREGINSNPMRNDWVFPYGRAHGANHINWKIVCVCVAVNEIRPPFKPCFKKAIKIILRFYHSFPSESHPEKGKLFPLVLHFSLVSRFFFIPGSTEQCAQIQTIML